VVAQVSTATDGRHSIELAPPEDEGRYLVKCYDKVIGQYLWVRATNSYACWFAVDGAMYRLGGRAADARAAFESILKSHECDIDVIGGE